MSKRVEYLLREWGKKKFKYADWADEYGENILYRAGIFGGRQDRGPDSHKVLCPDFPAWYKDLDKKISKMPQVERDAITLWYCAPPREDGRLFTARQLGSLLGISESLMRKRLSEGRKWLRRRLSR